MLPLPENTIQTFAEAFASGRNGLSLSEIGEFFKQYQPNIPSSTGTPGLTKPAYFQQCVLSLTPADQRLSLLDLCNSPPPSRHPMPSEQVRIGLRDSLFQVHGRSPVSTSLSSLTLRGVRENWWKIGSRIATNPDAAVTASRTLLEATCKTILSEMGETPDESGDLARLVKQTTRALGIADNPQDQPTKQLLSGIMSMVSGVAGISNSAGDRHGQVGGGSMRDVCLAELVANCCGSVAVFLTRKHRLSQLDAGSTQAGTE
jgi:hypothetical protein